MSHYPFSYSELLMFYLYHKLMSCGNYYYSSFVIFNFQHGFNYLLAYKHTIMKYLLKKIVIYCAQIKEFIFLYAVYRFRHAADLPAGWLDSCLKYLNFQGASDTVICCTVEPYEIFRWLDLNCRRLVSVQHSLVISISLP